LVQRQTSGTEAQQDNRVLNSFMLLTLQAHAITEEWIDQTGGVCWSQTLAM
jgi:hypothetical protein